MTANAAEGYPRVGPQGPQRSGAVAGRQEVGRAATSKETKRSAAAAAAAAAETAVALPVTNESGSGETNGLIVSNLEMSRRRARARGGGSDIICAGVEGKRKFDAESGKERREEGKMTHFARSMPRLFMPTHTLPRKLAHTSCFGTDDVRRDKLPTTGFEDVAV